MSLVGSSSRDAREGADFLSLIDPHIVHHSYAHQGVPGSFECHLYDSSGIEELSDVVQIL